MNDRSQVINQNRPLNPPQQVMRKINPPPPPQFINQSHLMGQSVNFSQPRGSVMKQRSYRPWQTQQDSNFNKKSKFHGSNQGFGTSNWKNAKPNQLHGTVMNGVAVGFGGGYQPPTVNELQHKNRVQARNVYPKKKFTNRFAPYAPRNTSSFIMRAKKSGGIASLVSPCPLTPAVLPTPVISPSREVLVDMAKEEWGVDGYGSMKGLIRLRNEEEDENEEDSGSSESDVDEEGNSVLNRLDHEMSRFEMVYPNQGGDYNNLLENRVDDQDSHIAQLEEENLILKERLFLMESDLGDLRRRLLFLERQNQVVCDVNEDNVSENGSLEVPDHGNGRESKQEVMDYVDANIKERVCDDYDDDINVVTTLNKGSSEDMVIFSATEAVLDFDLEKVSDDPSNEDVKNETEEVTNEEEQDRPAVNAQKKCNEDGESLHP